MIMQPMPDQHRLILPSHATHFLNSAVAMRRPPNFLQQMAIQQQQQLVHQLQLSQRQLMLQHSLPLQQDSKQSTREDLAGIWSGLVNENSDLNPNVNCESALGINGLLASMCINRRDLTNGNHCSNMTDEENHEANILYSSQGVCRWPSCEIVCEDYQSFIKHLNNDHRLDDRSTAQTRVQAQVVNQLELQLQSERDRLNAMMQHLHMFKRENILNDAENETSNDMTYPNLTNVSPTLYQMSQSSGVNVSQSQSMTGNVPSLISSNGSTSIPLPSSASSKTRNSHKTRRMNDTSAGLPYMLERAGLDVQQEINRNREFYRSADVRPPFTYASLIRQSIIESPDKQLTLNEIYNWFQNTFCYFRRNAATWKNAIRTNLSLHKCFVRYEDDFGSFWMVDDAEFVKRRHLSRGRPRKYDPLCSPNQGASATKSTTTSSVATTNAVNTTNSTITSSNSSTSSTSSSHSNTSCCTSAAVAVTLNKQESQIEECPYGKNSSSYVSNNNCNSNNIQNPIDDTYHMYSSIRLGTPSPKRMKISYDIASFTSASDKLNYENNSNGVENVIKKELANIDFNCNTSLESSRNAERDNESISFNEDDDQKRRRRLFSPTQFDRQLRDSGNIDEEKAEDLSMSNNETS